MLAIVRENPTKGDSEVCSSNWGQERGRKEAKRKNQVISAFSSKGASERTCWRHCRVLPGGQRQ